MRNSTRAKEGRDIIRINQPGQLEAALSALKALYETCPPVECYMCGACCVDPHMTYLEFVALLDDLTDNFPPKGLSEIVLSPPVRSQVFEGSEQCPMQMANLCLAREGRTLSCRLEGLSVMDTLFRRDPPLCAHAETKTEAQPVTESEVEGLLRRLFALNGEFYPVGVEPYFLDGLNLRSWLAVCLDKSITQEPFASLRATTLARHDLAFLGKRFVDHTGLAQKLRLIDRFREANGNQEYKKALDLIERISTEFPHTGTYYYWQASAFACQLNGILA